MPTTSQFKNKDQKFWDKMQKDATKIETIAGTVVASIFSLNQEINDLSSSHAGDKGKGVAEIGMKADLYRQMAKSGTSVLQKMLPESIQNKAGEFAGKVSDSMKNVLESMGFDTTEEEGGTEITLALGKVFAKNLTASLASLTSEATADTIIETMATAGAALDSVAPFLLVAQLLGMGLDLWNPCGFGSVMYQDNLDNIQFVMKTKLNGYISEQIILTGGNGIAPISVYPDYQPINSKDPAIIKQLGNLAKQWYKDNNYDPSKVDKVNFPFEEMFITLYTTVISEIKLAFPSYIKALKIKYNNDNILSKTKTKTLLSFIGFMAGIIISLIAALILTYILATYNFTYGLTKGMTVLFTITFYIVFIILIYIKYFMK